MVEARLPALRQDLKLLPGSHDEDGAPRWLLYDGVRNRYFTLALSALDLIKHWQPGVTAEEMSAYLGSRALECEAIEIRAFADFLISNNLVIARSEGASDYFAKQKRDSQKSLWRWLLHNYLFVRIPLVRPDPLLAKIAPRLSWLFSSVVHWTILFLGLLGALLVLRQWDSFTSTFLYFFSLEGMLLYALTLVVVKSAHELGHALVSQRLGCRVASMGVAFLVMFPVLYTDTTDAWKLRSKRDRLRIVTAGVRTELYLALLATFLWGILPDGAWRSAAFFVATTSWITSVLVNISPFLRFDGYYAFSDLIGIENLQQRSFALGRWRMRRWLWGINDPLPEPLPRPRARLLIAYAWCTWVYRLFLFLGIALLVYHFFFKVLGILLFVVEILWFIVMPIVKELKVWRERHADFHFTPLRFLAWSLPVIVLVLGILPLSTEVPVSAVIKVDRFQYMFVPEPAQVAELHVSAGDRVEAGDFLLRLKAPALENAMLQIREELQLAELRLARLAASPQEKAEQANNRERIRQLQLRLAALELRQQLLGVRAPFAGFISALEILRPDQWVGKDQLLLTLVDPATLKVEGFVSEQDLNLLSIGSPGVFISNSGEDPALPVVLEQIDVSAIASLPYPELGSDTGGSMAVRQVDKRLIPETAHYRISVRLDSYPAKDRALLRQPGILLLEGKKQSWLWKQGQRILAIALRESSF
ncbi:HlyD family efflux transporter periplasmic adaptor subunit [Neptunomonas antarctica]|uniref:Putative peptide zinc metalloprotease protein n=1 Tax=Neptunomonas antarctica TaxID=619304 RepID=A0A1N7J9L0_9GAMM|nr:HlyD family efflux transporter periplasmic adaptor subunit [Neptunomonas antarctica]SIS46043.1 putative peptide zinc metalloprotease protein [Neptunomonas antarctica]